MGEIKFRAWNKVKKEMFDNAIYNAPDSFEMILKHPQAYEVMQYTGIKDKNGKEIYEGDIVKAQDPSPYKEKGPIFYIYEVVFTEGVPFMLRRQYNNYGAIKLQYFSLRVMEVEIIGNIYDNPELLKGEVNSEKSNCQNDRRNI